MIIIFSWIYIVEVIKVRLQLANSAVTTSTSTMKAGLLETTRKIFRTEGIRAFGSGLTPAVVRGLFYGGVRLGIFIPMKIYIKQISLINLGAYGPIKNMLKRVVTDDKQATIKFVRNVTAACLSGTIAAVSSNPIDLCKTKLQAKNSPYTSTFHVIKDVVKHHGVKGLWVGTIPAAIRTGKNTSLC
jgi:solute carrier family 25 uncoupling protein 8/9